MIYFNKLVRLVCANLEVLEDAPKIINEVSDKLFAAVNRRIKARIQCMEGWRGIYDLITDETDGETAILPPSWPLSRGGSYMACYELSYLHQGQGAGMYWLSLACGVREQMSWQFTVSSDFHKKEMPVFEKDLADFYNDHKELAEHGVILEGPHLHLLFSFDRKHVATDYPNYDNLTFLKPLDEAIDSLLKVHPIIDQFVKKFHSPQK